MQNSVLALSYNWKNDYYRSNVRDFDGRLSWQKCVMAWIITSLNISCCYFSMRGPQVLPITGLVPVANWAKSV